MHSCINAFICLRALIQYITNCSLFNCWNSAFSVHEILAFDKYSFWHEEEFIYHSIALKRAGISIPFSLYLYYPDTIWSVFNDFCVCVKKHYYCAVRNLENLRSLWSMHLTVILGTWTVQKLARHFKEEVPFYARQQGQSIKHFVPPAGKHRKLQLPKSRAGVRSLLGCVVRVPGVMEKSWQGRSRRMCWHRGCAGPLAPGSTHIP